MRLTTEDLVDLINKTEERREGIENKDERKKVFKETLLDTFPDAEITIAFIKTSRGDNMVPYFDGERPFPLGEFYIAQYKKTTPTQLAIDEEKYSQIIELIYIELEVYARTQIFISKSKRSMS